MPKGLARFRDHFADYTDKYVLIGGSACELNLDEAGLEFRATKDLDIVLTVASLEPGFSAAFWNFVTDGGYEHARVGAEKSTQCYRFTRPKDSAFPAMLELFARKSDCLRAPDGRPIGRVVADADASSLSAILMNDDYYALVTTGRRVADRLSFLEATHVIPLKAKAYLDLSARKEGGKSEKSADIKKHKHDVFRLAPLLAETARVVMAEPVRADFSLFLEEMQKSPPDLAALNIQGDPVDVVLARLKSVYL